MPSFVIRVTADDQSDLDFIREKCLAVVQDEIAENKERFDSEVSVDWEWGDD